MLKWISIFLLVTLERAWTADNIESALTNAPRPYSSTILIPTAVVPTALVPKAIVPRAVPAMSPEAYQPITPAKPTPRYLPVPASGSDYARQHLLPKPAPVATAPVAPTPPPLPALPSVEQTLPAAKPSLPISRAWLFNTADADRILAAMQIFPSNNVWHADIRQWPLHSNSKNIIAAISLVGRPLAYNYDMGFVIVPKGAPRANVQISPSMAESDLGPYPLPENVPIEGWPLYFKRSKQYSELTLDNIQRDIINLGGDRHAIVVDPNDQKLYEFFAMRKTLQGWQASSAAIFDLSSNKLRPDGWTSADAAGLPIFPAVVRYDELVRGKIDHALRVTVPRTSRAYVAPATHFASKLTDPDLPRMGERLRLRHDYDLTSFSPEVQTILTALKKHGMFVADNGAIFAISVAPDERIPNVLDELHRVTVADFEVVREP